MLQIVEAILCFLITSNISLAFSKCRILIFTVNKALFLSKERLHKRYCVPVLLSVINSVLLLPYVQSAS